MALSANSLVTVAEAGAFCKLDAATIVSDTSLLETVIAAVTQWAEDYTNRCFITRTLTETQVGEGSITLRLRKWPATDVTSITVSGVALTTWVERLSIGRLYLQTSATIYNTAWPLDEEIVIVYTAGYGARAAAQAACPNAVLAVLMMIAGFYESREDGVESVSISGLGSVSYGKSSKAKELLNPLVVPQC